MFSDFQRAIQGGPGFTVVIFGPGCSGKTTLARNFLRAWSLEGSNWVVASTNREQFAGHVPAAFLHDKVDVERLTRLPRRVGVVIDEASYGDLAGMRALLASGRRVVVVVGEPVQNEPLPDVSGFAMVAVVGQGPAGTYNRWRVTSPEERFRVTVADPTAFAPAGNVVFQGPIPRRGLRFRACSWTMWRHSVEWLAARCAVTAAVDTILQQPSTGVLP